MILVVGSTGLLGGEICRRLAAQGKHVRGLVRATSLQERVAHLKSEGVETVLGDLRQPATLAEACRGVSTVISTATTTVSMQPGDSIPLTDHQGQLNLVQAAQAAGVKQFIYVSYSKNIEPGANPCPLTVAKRSVESALVDSGMIYTILKPSYFMDMWLSPAVGFDYPNSKANIFGDGHAKISFISLGDVAQFAVESVDNPMAQNAVIELGGPKAVSWLEVVRIFEQAGGKPFELQFIPVSALQAQKESATNPLEISFAGLMLSATHDHEVDMRPAAKIFSIPLTPVDEYARRVMAS